jgi:hypothetical protein
MNIEQLDDLISKYPLNKVQGVGTDGKYHYVYKIVFENGLYYIGKHSTSDLLDDYFASGKLPNKYKNEGYLFIREILSYEKSSKSALFLESCILSNGSIYGQPECLNCYPGSPPSTQGSIVIKKNNRFKMINKKLVDYYLENGWELGAPKRIRMSNGLEDKYVLLDEIDEYENIGYFTGRVKMHDRIFIEMDGKFKFISPTDIVKYETLGWIKKHPHEGTTVLKRDGIVVKVESTKVESLLEQGYVRTSTVEDLIYIRKEGKFRRVAVEDVSSYLENGWELGTNICGTIYVNDGIREFRINAEVVDEYVRERSCVIGRLNYVFLNNGIKEVRINPNNKTKISEYVQGGYVIGKLTRTTKRKVKKGGEIRYIIEKKLQGYVDRGWEIIH